MHATRRVKARECPPLQSFKTHLLSITSTIIILLNGAAFGRAGRPLSLARASLEAGGGV